MAIDLQANDWGPIGQAIRDCRLAKQLTLVDVAAKAGLSQPFLSQVETGKARPSLISLHQIADALDTTPQSFFGGPVDSDTVPQVVRADAVQVLEVGGAVSASTCHVLLGGAAPFHMLEFDGLPDEFLEYYEHDGFEAAYVISGTVEIDIAGTLSTLRAGDSISYSARMAHRFRSTGRRRARVLLIETKVLAMQDRSPGQHSPKLKARRRTKAK